MRETGKNRANSFFRTNLDDKVTVLSEESMRSVMGLLTHLESRARKEEKSAFILPEKSDLKKAFHLLAEKNLLPYRKQEALTFRELGRQLIRTAGAQVRLLRAYSENLQLLVLINNWRTAEALWLELLPELQTPLLELNLLKELWGVNPEWVGSGGVSLTLHQQQFVLIQSEMDDVLRHRQSLVELSDFIEGPIGKWLLRFDRVLGELDEMSVT